MGKSVSHKRPWLAALLAALVTGLGHLYLRRWRRAVGWLIVVLGVSTLFVDPAALTSLTTPDPIDLVALAPLLVVGSLSVADAYLLALAQNAVARARSGPSEQMTRCPHCGGQLDPALEFCHWCTAPVEPPEEREIDGADERASS